MWRALTTVLLVSLFCAAASAAPPGPPASREFHFTLQVPEVIIANFDSVAGLIVETEVTEFRDGTSG
ncbi:MAG TPA: hypothetical protein VM779_01600, partial [Thermoanaerobaculia bacterium]|nr:hypothetical protein [Thermoanaerobaculia bacterium]